MAECGAIDLNCKSAQLLDSVTDDLTTDIKEGVSSFITGVFAGWMNVPVPILGQDFGVVGFLYSHLLVIAGMVLGISTVFFAIRLMWKPSREVIGNGAAFYLRVIVVTAGGVTLARMLIHVCDGYSRWVLESATGGTGLADTVLSTLQLTGPIGWFLAAAFGIIGFIAALMQAVLLAMRNVMLPLLVGASPVVVAASQSEFGMNWWTKYVSWFTAFLLYKPTAATIYAVGFYMLEQGNVLASDSIGEAAVRGMNFVYGLVLLVLAILAFGALMSVVTPVTGKLTGGMAGAAIIGASAASLAASGAVSQGGRPGNPAVGAPVSVSPSNAAAQGATGAVGTTGAAGAAGPAGAAAQGARLAADTGARAQQSISNGINNQQSEEQ